MVNLWRNLHFAFCATTASNPKTLEETVPSKFDSVLAAATLIAIGLTYPPLSPSQPQTAPVFEIASVKRAAVQSGMPRITGGPGTSSPGQLNANAPLWTLIMTAYSVRPWQFSGPAWLRDERWDIAAKIPAGATKEQINPMLQNLLAERFGLVVHWEPKAVPLYELALGRGKLRLKNATAPSGTQSEQPSTVAFSIRGLLDGR